MAATKFKNPPAKEDTWAFQPVGTPFPDNPVKVMGEQNMYVALWYKHGKPIHGRSWNNGGVVECSFPYGKAELKTKAELEGQIQVLQFKGDHNTLGFWYEWILYKDRFDKANGAEPVRCGDSYPIFWKGRPEGNLLGYLNNKTEEALFSHNGQVISKKGGELSDMYIINRNFLGGPAYCPCTKCIHERGPPECKCDKCKVAPPPPPPPPGPPPPKILIDEWMDIRCGDPWPTKELVKAMFKNLDTIAGQNPEQYVALWYMQGEPVMGRAWNDGGKINASFSWKQNEYTGTASVGSMQLLIHLGEHVRGFDYGWIPFPEAAKFGEKEWHPVHVNNGKVDMSVGVITLEGKQILGKADIKNEKVSAGWGGKEYPLTGPAAASNTVVLCRKPKPGYKLDG